MVKSQSEARIDDKHIVGCLGAVRKGDRVVIRLESVDSKLSPVEAWSLIKQVFLGSNDVPIFLRLGLLCIAEDASTNHCVGWLVMVLSFGIKNGDITCADLARSGKLSCKRLTAAAGTDDSNFSVLSCG